MAHQTRGLSDDRDWGDEHPSRRTTALPVTSPSAATVLVRNLRVMMKNYPRSALLSGVKALIEEYERKTGKVD